jgi:IS605 OrfB family transposase
MKHYSSVRIYKETLNKQYVNSIMHTLLTWNRAKHYAYNVQLHEKRSNQQRRSESIHKEVKKHFNMNDYYTNSAVQEANALHSSQQELKTLYIKQKEKQIESIKKKIKYNKNRLTVFNKTSPEQKRGNFFVVEYKKETKLFYNGYLFEHVYLEPKIKFIRAQLGRFQTKLNRYQQQLEKLKTTFHGACFGTKDLFKAQHTVDRYIKNHKVWKRTFEKARYNRMLISGRKDAKDGNFVFRYDVTTHTLHFQTIDGKAITLSGVTFPYGQKRVDLAVSTQLNCKDKKKYGKPMAWGIKDCGEYFLIHTSFQLPKNENVNYSKSTGVVGIDCNVEHFAVSNINQKGQLIASFVQSFSLDGKSSHQITKIIENEAVSLVEYAIKHNKPSVLEKLDTTLSKVSNTYGNKKANKQMSLFAYRKMISAIKSRAEKMGVAVFEVNPAYTSQIGKMKYMKKFGISIHQSAAYVIARRGMGYKEKLPPVLFSLLPEKMAGKHHWVHWKFAMNSLKDIRTHAFYRSELFDLGKFQKSSELFVPGCLSTKEQMGLTKLLK